MRSWVSRVAALAALIGLLSTQAIRYGEVHTLENTASLMQAPLSDEQLAGAGRFGAWLKANRQAIIETAECIGLGVTVGAAIGGIVTPVAGIVAGLAAVRCFV